MKYTVHVVSRTGDYAYFNFRQKPKVRKGRSTYRIEGIAGTGFWQDVILERANIRSVRVERTA
jgi:hypothetical protein